MSNSMLKSCAPNISMHALNPKYNNSRIDFHIKFLDALAIYIKMFYTVKLDLSVYTLFIYK